MKGRFLFAACLLVACVSEPAPWRPDGAQQPDVESKDAAATVDVVGEGVDVERREPGDLVEVAEAADGAVDTQGEIQEPADVVEVTDLAADGSGEVVEPADILDVSDGLPDAGEEVVDPVDVVEAGDLPGDVPVEDVCMPDCAGVDCGDDGCGGSCWVGEGVECDDANPCTVDACEAGVGCQHAAVADGTPCEDGEVCWVGDGCLAGVCESGDEINPCDDANPCTMDSCKPKVGCQNVALEDGTECSDNDACTVGDVCAEGLCQSGEPLDCDDGIWCSTDLCGPEAGCYYEVAPACESADDDWDNDGLANMEDACPYAFDPGNPDLNDIPGPDACEALADHGEFVESYPLVLTVDGGVAQERRTNEPVEVLLRNAPATSSPLARWEWQEEEPSETATGFVTSSWKGVVPAVDPFGVSQAFGFSGDGSYLQGNGYSELHPSHVLDHTVMLWFRVSGDVTQTTTLFSNSAQVVWGTYLTAEWTGINLRLGTYCTMDSNGKKTAGNWGFVYYSLGRTNSCVAVGSDQLVADGQWHHVAAVYSGDDKLQRFYLDGDLAATGTEPAEGIDYYYGRTVWGASPTYDDTKSGVAAWGWKDHFAGDIGEPLLFDRALSAQEIREYVESSEPYGSVLVPSPAGDYSDLRLTEMPGPGEPGPETVKRMALYTLRPHSQQACPAASDGVPAADRDDLCEVVAYWPLDGVLNDVGEAGLDVTGIEPGYGDGVTGVEGGSWEIAPASHNDFGVVPYDPALDFGAGEFTIEFWLNLRDEPAVDNSNGHEDLFLLAKREGWSAPQNQGHQHMLGNGFDFWLDYALHLNFSWGAASEGHVSFGTLDLDRWYHVAVVASRLPGENETRIAGYLDGKRVYWNAFGASDFVSDAANDLWLGRSDFYSDAPQSRVLLDDLLIHRVAKSPGYIARRAYRGAPRLRFLASTTVADQDAGAGTSYPSRTYTLRVTDGAAPGALPYVPGADGTTCGGLLNECLGYFGYWPLDGTTRDVSDNGRHLQGDEVPYVPGARHLAARFEDQSDLDLDVPLYGDASSYPEAVTLEVVFKPEQLWQKSRLLGGVDNDYTLATSGTGADAVLTWSVAGEGETEYTVTVPGVTMAKVQAARAVATSEALTLYLDDASAQVPAGPLGWTPYWRRLAVAEVGNGFYRIYGLLDEVRMMLRALPVDEMLHYPRFHVTVE